MQTAAPVGWTSNSTLELWLQHTQDTGVIASTGTSGTGDYVFVRQITPTLVQLYVDYASTADNTIEFTVGAGLGDGHWHHVVLVLRSSGTIAELFINGIAAVPNRALVTAIAHTRNFILGFDPALSGEYWTGGFDEVAIYPRVLSPADIAAHYAARLSQPVTGTITVTFQSDSQGGQPDDWYDAGQAFAYIEPLNAAERLAVSAVAATVNYRAVVHYRRGLTPQMKLLWLRYQESDPRELAIFGVYPHPEPAYAHRFLVLECGELA
jgi:SPP1 family predicted phage head-tail adaptor